MAEVFVPAWRQAYPGLGPDAELAGPEHDPAARRLAGQIERRPEGETDVAVQDGQVTGYAARHVFAGHQRARWLCTRVGCRPDGSTRVGAQYQAREGRLVQALP